MEEERERNAESRAALEAELMEARRSSQQLAQLSAVRMQLQNAAAEPVSSSLSIHLFTVFFSLLSVIPW